MYVTIKGQQEIISGESNGTTRFDGWVTLNGKRQGILGDNILIWISHKRVCRLVSCFAAHSVPTGFLVKPRQGS